MIASRASFIKPKKSTFTVGEPTPKPSVDLEPILKEIQNHGSIFIDPYTTLYSQVQQT